MTGRDLVTDWRGRYSQYSKFILQHAGYVKLTFRAGAMHQKPTLVAQSRLPKFENAYFLRGIRASFAA
jgi:hypothetical protein